MTAVLIVGGVLGVVGVIGFMLWIRRSVVEVKGQVTDAVTAEQILRRASQPPRLHIARVIRFDNGRHRRRLHFAGSLAAAVMVAWALTPNYDYRRTYGAQPAERVPDKPSTERALSGPAVPVPHKGPARHQTFTAAEPVKVESVTAEMEPTPPAPVPVVEDVASEPAPIPEPVPAPAPVPEPAPEPADDAPPAEATTTTTTTTTPEPATVTVAEDGCEGRRVVGQLLCELTG